MAKLCSIFFNGEIVFYFLFNGEIGFYGFLMAKSTFVCLRARCAATVQPSRAMQARSSQGQSHREPTPRARQTPNVPKQVHAGPVFPPKATASQQLVPHVRRGAVLHPGTFVASPSDANPWRRRAARTSQGPCAPRTLRPDGLGHAPGQRRCVHRLRTSTHCSGQSTWRFGRDRGERHGTGPPATSSGSPTTQQLGWAAPLLTWLDPYFRHNASTPTVCQEAERADLHGKQILSGCHPGGMQAIRVHCSVRAAPRAFPESHRRTAFGPYRDESLGPRHQKHMSTSHAQALPRLQVKPGG